MKQYKVTLKHDKGTSIVIVKAISEESARTMILASENCPPSAIIKIKANKYTILHVVQGLYMGWEDLTASDSRQEAMEDIKAYRANEKGAFRLITRKVLNA